MLLLLSGEGPADVGSTALGDDGEIFLPGPLTLLVDRMVEDAVGFSPIGCGVAKHISRGALYALAKSQETVPRQLLPGIKRPAGYDGYFRQAFALARHAQKMEELENDYVIAVLFRDTDGTRSTEASRWSDLVNAIRGAFRAAGFVRGVPMIAKPKQEAWFLCALKADPYENCSALEDESGNDNSPNSLKKQLDDIFNAVCDRDVLVQVVENDEFDHSRIDMPSFNEFRSQLLAAIRNCRNQ